MGVLKRPPRLSSRFYWLLTFVLFFFFIFPGKPVKANSSQTILESREYLARAVEAARVTGHSRELLEILPDQAPRGIDPQVYRIFQSALYQLNGQYKKMAGDIHPESRTLPDTRIYLLHRYDLLPLLFLSRGEYGDFYRGTPPQKRSILKRNTTPASPGLYKQFIRARLLWDMGNFDRAHSLWSSLLERISRDWPLYEEAYKLRFIEVEGTFTMGQPLKWYLEEWAKAVKKDRVKWWYQSIGTLEDEIPYFRYYESNFSNEPLGLFATRALKDQTGSDLALMNHQGMRGGLDSGPVTRNELYLAFPWNNTPIRVMPDVDSTKVKSVRQHTRDQISELSQTLPNGDALSFSDKSCSCAGSAIDLPDETFRSGFTLVMSEYMLDRTSGFIETKRYVRTIRDMALSYIREQGSVEPPPYDTPDFRSVAFPPMDRVVQNDTATVNEGPFSDIGSMIFGSVITAVYGVVSLVFFAAILVSWIQDRKHVVRNNKWALRGIIVFLIFQGIVISARFWYGVAPMESSLWFKMGMGIGTVIALVYGMFKMYLFISVGMYHSRFLRIPSLPLFRFNDRRLTNNGRFEYVTYLSWIFVVLAGTIAWSYGLLYWTEPSMSSLVESFQNNSSMGLSPRKAGWVLGIGIVGISFMEEVTFRLGFQNFLAYV
ncbi:MAG: 5'-nucleotidase C-terminal domain-containing protein, partial [bacterium]